MYPKEHVILGAVFSLILFLLFPQIGLLGFLIIFLSAVLIDVDHYIWYIWKKKDLSLKTAYNWFVKTGKKFRSLPRRTRNKFYTGFCFFHGVESLILLFFLGLVSKYVFFVFIGFIFHLVLDVVYATAYTDRVDRVLAIYDFVKFKKLMFIEDHV